MGVKLPCRTYGTCAFFLNGSNTRFKPAKLRTPPYPTPLTERERKIKERKRKKEGKKERMNGRKREMKTN